MTKSTTSQMRQSLIDSTRLQRSVIRGPDLKRLLDMRV